MAPRDCRTKPAGAFVSSVDAGLAIDEDAFAPDALQNFRARNELSTALNQQAWQLERNPLERNYQAAPAQLIGICPRVGAYVADIDQLEDREGTFQTSVMEQSTQLGYRIEVSLGDP